MADLKLDRWNGSLAYLHFGKVEWIHCRSTVGADGKDPL